MFRRQLPVLSPVHLGVLGAGIKALWQPAAISRERLSDVLAARFGAASVLLADSGTSALCMAFSAAVPGPIAMPAYSCFDLASAAVGAGRSVWLYDVDPTTLGPDQTSLERALRNGVSAVVVVHLYGHPVDIDRVQSQCHAHGACVIEDAAQGLGGSYAGKPLGSHGSISILSFGRGKGLTGGGGGAALAHDDAGVLSVESARESLANGGRGARSVARVAAQWLISRPMVFGVPARLPYLHVGETVYRKPSRPKGITVASSRMVRVGMPRAFAEADIRRRNAEMLRKRLRDSTALRFVDAPDEASSGCLRLPAIATDDTGTTTGSEQWGVMRGYPRPLSALPPLAPLIVNHGDRFPGAIELARHLITLPTHSKVTTRDTDAIGRAFGS